MRTKRVLLGLAAAGLASSLAAAVGERRLLTRMNRIPPPEGWEPPVFPSTHQLMVPTDDGAELCVGVAGPDHGAVVVLVHGLTSNQDDWGPVATRLLANGHRVIALNQRGHGGSTVGHDGFTPDRLGRDVGQVLLSLDLREVTLVGHSMGGVAAMALTGAPERPGAERVARLALVATLMHTGRPDRLLSLHVGNTDFYQELAEHPQHAAAVARFVFGATPSRVLVDQALASNRRCPRDTRERAALGLLGYDIRPQLAAIDCPTVVICGTHDRLTPFRENRALADAIPGAQLIKVDGAGHLVIWERADTVADAITAITATSRPAART